MTVASWPAPSECARCDGEAWVLEAPRWGAPEVPLCEDCRAQRSIYLGDAEREAEPHEACVGGCGRRAERAHRVTGADGTWAWCEPCWAAYQAVRRRCA